MELLGGMRLPLLELLACRSLLHLGRIAAWRCPPYTPLPSHAEGHKAAAK